MSSYLGNQPASSYAGNIVVQQFSGTGAQVTFILDSEPVTVENLDVFVNGVYQQKSTYGVYGTSLTFSEAPLVGTNNIEVKIFEVLPMGGGTGVSDASQVSYTPEFSSIETTVAEKLNKLTDQDSVLILTKAVKTTTYTIPDGYNAVSAGPITINSGVVVTVPTESTWVIV